MFCTHIYIYIDIQPFKQLALQSLQVVCFPKQSCFAHAIHLLWPLGRICHPNDPPALRVLEGIGAMISGAEYSRWRSNYTTQQKRWNIKIPPHLKELSLTKTDCFWWHDFFALVPTQLRQKRRGEAGFAALQPCMDAACFVSLALMGCFQDGWGACFQLATRWGESEATWLQPDHWQDGFMKWNENGNMNYTQWFDPCLRTPRHHIWYPQTQTGGLMTEPHRDFGSVVELRSSKEIVASLGWLKDLPMKSDVLVNRLQFFIFFQLFFLFFMSTLSIFVGAACQCLWMVGHDCFHELIYHLRTPAGQTGPQSTLRSRNSACWNPSRWDIPTIRPAKSSYIQQKNRISKSPSPWKKTRKLLVSNFLRQSRALRTLRKWKWTRHCSKKCSKKVPELAQWKIETTLWGKEFGNRSQWVVPSIRFDPHFGEDVCGTTVGTFFLSRSVPWEKSLAPCHGQAYLWWHGRRRRGTGWIGLERLRCFWKSGVWMLAEIHQKVYFPQGICLNQGQANLKFVTVMTFQIPKKPPALDMNALPIMRDREITQKKRRLVLSCQQR